MMRGRIWLVVGVALGVWVLALLRNERAPVRAPAPTPKAEPTERPEAATQAKQKARSPLKASEPRKPIPTVSRKEQDAYRQQLMEKAAEQRHQNDERYEDASRRWQGQGRTEPWASEREQRLRAAMQADRLDHLLIAAECRTNLCRLEISAPDTDTAMAFRNSIAFVKEVGTHTAGGMTGGGPDRALVIFVPREGG